MDEFVGSSYAKKLFDGITPGDGFPELVGKFDALPEADRRKLTDLVTGIGSSAQPIGAALVDILRAFNEDTKEEK